jgi:hypothetical protein
MDRLPWLPAVLAPQHLDPGLHRIHHERHVRRPGPRPAMHGHVGVIRPGRHQGGHVAVLMGFALVLGVALPAGPAAALRLPVVRLAHAAVPRPLKGWQIGRLSRQGRDRSGAAEGHEQGHSLDVRRPAHRMVPVVCATSMAGSEAMSTVACSSCLRTTPSARATRPTNSPVSRATRTRIERLGIGVIRRLIRRTRGPWLRLPRPGHSGYEMRTAGSAPRASRQHQPTKKPAGLRRRVVAGSTLFNPTGN